MVVLIHGISQQEFIGKEGLLLDKWKDLLRTGLNSCGATASEISAIADNARMIFYADLTDPKRVAQRAQSKAISIDAIEAQILNDLENQTTVKGLQNTRLAHLIAKWGDSFPIIRDGLIRASAKEAYGYFENPSCAQELDKRCDEIIGEERHPLIIGHSFGSVVAYRLISRKPRVARHLITLGSPLGTSFMKQNLRPEKTPVFSDLESWADFADPDDIVSYRAIEISEMFDAYRSAPPKFYSDRTIVNPTYNEHSIQGYLSQKVVAERILAAFRSGEQTK